MNNYKKVFRLSPNKIKFLISDYTPDRDRSLVHECTLLVGEKMLENGMSVLVEGGSIMQGKFNDELKALAQKYNVPVITVNIEAPLPALLERFQEWLEIAKLRGAKRSVTTQDEFMERYNAYLKIRGEAAKTFDSSTQMPEEIAKQIMELVS